MRGRGPDRGFTSYAVLSVLAVAWVGVMLRVIVGSSVPGAGSITTDAALAVCAGLALILALPIVLWAGRSVRRDASGGLRTDGRASTLLDALPALLWTTDRRLRLTGSIGGGLHSLGLPSARIREMPLPEFFHDLQVDSSLVAAHRRALGGEIASCEFRSERTWFRGVVQPLRRNGLVVGVVGVALEAIEEVVEHPSTLVLESDGVKLLDLSDLQDERARVTE